VTVEKSETRSLKLVEITKVSHAKKVFFSIFQEDDSIRKSTQEASFEIERN
jgi:hypothetical protein